MSASSKPVLYPFFSKPKAIFVEIVDFPTPPLPLPIAITLVCGLILVSGALSLAFFLAFSITELLSFLFIAVTSMFTVSIFSIRRSFL